MELVKFRLIFIATCRNKNDQKSIAFHIGAIAMYAQSLSLVVGFSLLCGLCGCQQPLIDQLTAENTELEQKNGQLDKTIQQLESEKADLTIQVDSVRKQFTDMKAATTKVGADAKKSIADLTKQLTALKVQTKQFGEDLTAAKKKAEDSAAAVKKANDAAATTVKENKKLKATIADLEKKLKEAKPKVPAGKRTDTDAKKKQE